jgi:HNH endonuclease
MRQNCSINDCNRGVWARGWCGLHYQRWRKRGDPNILLQAPDGTGCVSLGYRKLQVQGKRIQEHVLIAEKALGKSLPPKAEVHHVNGDGLDNRNSNLVICQNHAYHALLHVRECALNACGNVDWRCCHYCKKHDEITNMTSSHGGSSYFHALCQRQYTQQRHFNRSRDK